MEYLKGGSIMLQSALTTTTMAAVIGGTPYELTQQDVDDVMAAAKSGKPVFLAFYDDVLNTNYVMPCTLTLGYSSLNPVVISTVYMAILGWIPNVGSVLCFNINLGNKKISYDATP